ncbi:MAG: quinolinate synthase NadA [bacterium]
MAETYGRMDEEELRDRIRNRKEALGKRLVILGHHYQRQEVIDFADFRGDSLGLSRLAAAQKECEFIVFCGVHFMAESAEILRQEHQTVQHPDFRAGCPLAATADLAAVKQAWEIAQDALDDGSRRVMPVTYMNSEAALKAFCGRNGGAVCTSSNAPAAFRWAFRQAEKLFFFPDEHLGRNSARQIGIPRQEILLWDPESSPQDPEIGKKIRAASLLLWKGFCHVHTHFSVEHVRKARAASPGARIVVHPECLEEVVREADASGSTEFICRYVQEAPAGSTIFVGTEINLVSRLGREHPDKQVFELARSLCPNMFRIDLFKLLRTLEGIGRFNRVSVDPQTKEQARAALERMLEMG